MCQRWSGGDETHNDRAPDEFAFFHVVERNRCNLPVNLRNAALDVQCDDDLRDRRRSMLRVIGDAPAALRPYLPAFQHALVDLAATPDEALSTIARLRALLAALKYSRRPDLPERLGIILAEVEALEPRDLLMILTYLDRGPVAVSREKMRQLLRDRMPDQEETMMGWITQPYFEDGLAQGRAEGQAVGRAEGQARSLVRLLERRFGPLPEQLRARVFDADVKSLDAWLDRVFDAPDLHAVFAEPVTVRT
jgi:hypothetical protein